MGSNFMGILTSGKNTFWKALKIEFSPLKERLGLIDKDENDLYCIKA